MACAGCERRKQKLLAAARKVHEAVRVKMRPRPDRNATPSNPEQPKQG